MFQQGFFILKINNIFLYSPMMSSKPRRFKLVSMLQTQDMIGVLLKGCPVHDIIDMLYVNPKDDTYYSLYYANLRDMGRLSISLDPNDSLLFHCRNMKEPSRYSIGEVFNDRWIPMARIRLEICEGQFRFRVKPYHGKWNNYTWRPGTESLEIVKTLLLERPPPPLLYILERCNRLPPEIINHIRDQYVIEPLRLPIDYPERKTIKLMKESRKHHSKRVPSEKRNGGAIIPFHRHTHRPS